MKLEYLIVEQGRIKVENYGALLRQDLRELMRMKVFADVLDEADLVHLRGFPYFFTKISGLVNPDQHDFSSTVIVWLEKLLSERGTAQKLASASRMSASVQDPRIREYTREERQANVIWMKLGADIATCKMMSEVGHTSISAWLFLSAR
jgi:hypothetical protein